LNPNDFISATIKKYLIDGIQNRATNPDNDEAKKYFFLSFFGNSNKNIIV
jgi:hypothetical protein